MHFELQEKNIMLKICLCSICSICVIAPLLALVNTEC